MLLEFKLNNFRVFKDENVFSMYKNQSNALNDTLIEVDTNHEHFSLLPAKVIYGTNASGKSSILLAIDLLKKILLNKTLISNDKDSIYQNILIYHFIHDEKKYAEPISFYISFFNNAKYEYELKISKDGDLSAKVAYEKLTYNNVIIFERIDNIVAYNPSRNKTFSKYIALDDAYIKMSETLLKDNLNDASVFTQWFNLSKEIMDDFNEYIYQKLFIYFKMNQIKILPGILKEDDSTKVVNDALFRMVKEAEFGPQEIYFSCSDKNSNEVELRAKYNAPENFEVTLPSYLTESDGTIDLVYFLFPFMNAIITGGVLFFDELDASLHPEVMAAIIKCFENPNVNKKGAQLIFTTHNPVYLNKNLFRKDQIVFVEKNKKDYSSTIFTLADIEARSDCSYLKKYLEGKYIEFVNIDFSEIMKDIMK